MSDTGITGLAGAVSTAGQTPEQVVRARYPQYAWMLNIPEVAKAIAGVVANGMQDNVAAISGAIMGTKWYKESTPKIREWQETFANDPGAASRAVDSKAMEIQKLAEGKGFQIEAGRARALAQDAVMFDWTPQEMDTWVNAASYGPEATVTKGGSIEGNLGLVHQWAGDQFQVLAAGTANNYARALANGTMTAEGVKEIFRQQAMVDHPEYAGQLAGPGAAGGGATMNDLFSNHRQQIAATLEMDPDSIDFVTNPTWAKVVKFVPPGESQGRAMTTSEALNYARQQPGYRFTDGANKMAADMSQAILQTWGALG